VRAARARNATLGRTLSRLAAEAGDRTRLAVADFQPLPGIGQVYALIRDAHHAGQRIELTVEGEPGDIPATVELGVYRLLEEALLDTGLVVRRR
jgi:signal transduction histidine kinase